MNQARSLYDLNQSVKAGLMECFPDTCWVQAEVGECREHASGHCYLELIEKKAGTDQLCARARAVIWSNVWLFLKPFFEEQTESSLQVGQKILVEAKVDFHSLYGLNLVIHDIDPAYTIGEWAMRRQEILRRLQQEGVADLNKELPFPVCPQRIAVIASPSSAGYGDFMQHLRNAPQRFVFYTALFRAVMQGGQAEESIMQALDRILEHAEQFDLVVIIRGGGASMDLSCFDAYELASAVAQFPLPVLSGIGHERDESIIDKVACVSVKTPTAAAECLLNLLGQSWKNLENTAFLLKENIQKIKEEERSKEQRKRMRLYHLCQSAARQFERNMENIAHQLRFLADKRLREEEHRLILMEKNREACSPETQLKRGYSMTLQNGRLITSPKELIPGELMETHLRDGCVWSRPVDCSAQERLAEE